MRQPLWLINASLLCILLVGELIFLFLQTSTSIPRRFSLVPGSVKAQEKKIAIEVDIKKICEVSDLFGTYEVPIVVKDDKAEQIPAIPLPPPAIPLEIKVEAPPVFIAPLAVVLKGVVYLHDDSEESVAIIQFKDSKKEHNYRVGEMIMDAQILKIFPNRIIVVRSNGQQETLYLRPKDLEKDFEQEIHKNDTTFTITSKDDKRYVPLDAFLKQIHSLGQFIDMLELRTVYKQGKNIGCRVGNVAKDSLGSKLGFDQGDLIKKIDSISVVDLNSRLEVYDHIVQKTLGDEIVVEIDRNDKTLHMTFVLSGPAKNSPKTVGAKKVAKDKDHGVQDETKYTEEEQKQKILAQRVKLAPTAHQIHMAEQKKLLEARKKNMLSRRHA